MIIIYDEHDLSMFANKQGVLPVSVIHRADAIIEIKGDSYKFHKDRLTGINEELPIDYLMQDIQDRLTHRARMFDDIPDDIQDE